MSELKPSESCQLGRKEFWEEFYTTELQNFDEFGDLGEIWFGKKNVKRIVEWLVEHGIEKNMAILDVGCGNGVTLLTLAKSGFKHLTGVDYAPEAISLAKKIASAENVEIQFDVMDFLRDAMKAEKTFNVIIDKGTYDAICLNTEQVKENRSLYLDQIRRLLTPLGYFLLFSCNWTKEELIEQFADFKVHDEIPIPSISFGGQIGQTITALVFTKKCSSS